MPEQPSSQQRLRIVLERIQVLTSHDLAGPGEFRFHVDVYRPGDLASRQRHTLPAHNFFQLEAGQSIGIEQVVFEDGLLKEDRLVVQIAGVEHDLVLHDHLQPYYREFQGRVADWAGHYGPDADPAAGPVLEALADWKVWYRVEVE